MYTKNPSSDQLKPWPECMAMCRIYYLEGVLSMLKIHKKDLFRLENKLREVISSQ